jgi:hypothetical protein
MIGPWLCEEEPRPISWVQHPPHERCPTKHFEFFILAINAMMGKAHKNMPPHEKSFVRHLFLSYSIIDLFALFRNIL